MFRDARIVGTVETRETDMAITPEMVERFKAEYPDARSATAAAKLAKWSPSDARMFAAPVAVALGLQPKEKYTGFVKKNDPQLNRLEEELRVRFPDEVALYKMLANLATRAGRRVKLAKAATQ